MNDRQLIYAKLIDILGSVAFIHEIKELKDASQERMEEFVEVKRQVREEIQTLASGEKPKAKKQYFSTAKYKTHDGEKGSPEKWREAAKIILNVNGENCLSTLGLTGVPATEAELKKVYRDAIRKAHPDVGGSEDEAARINAAYELALNLFFTKPPVDAKGKRKDTGLRPQLLTPIEESEASMYIEDDLWCAQEKMDGKHAIIKKEGSTIIAANKQGLEMSIPKSVEDGILSNFGCNVILDGELIGGKFYVFDILEYDNIDYRKGNFYTRYSALIAIWPKPAPLSIILVPAYFSRKDTQEFFNDLKAKGKEGIVFKKIDAIWSEGRPEAGGDMVKCKFWATLSAIVDEQETGKSSFISYVLDHKTGERVYLGNCSALGKEKPKPRDVVELRYLYAYPMGKLIQQVFLGIRDDVRIEECTTKQLKFKAKG